MRAWALIRARAAERVRDLRRDQVVESLDSGPAWDRYEISAPRLVPVGPGAAALVYRATAVRDGSAPFTALMSSVYCLVDGSVRLALYQQTTATH